LAESARAEQATGFDPSGLGCRAEIEGQVFDDVGNSGNGVSSTENATTVSDYSDGEVPKFTYQFDLSEQEKIDNLRLIFPNFKDHTIRFILKQTGGDLERAFDQLLDRQYLEESGELPRGVDGFYVPDYAVSLQGRGASGSGRARAKKGKATIPVAYSVVSDTIAAAEIEGGSGPSQVLTTTRTSARAAPGRLPRSDAVPKPAASTSLTNPSHMRAVASLGRLGPLGRQGAAIYVQRAIEETRYEMSKEADEIVARQSTPTSIDLHGVTVLDGVRIAKGRLRQWWEDLGEGRERMAKVQGFTVITGIGRHSANGVSRLRQAVGVALRNDGWNVETLTGKFYVTGRLSCG